MIAYVRARPVAQVALAVLMVGGGAFAWWTVSPLFLTTTLNEALPRATVPAATVAPASAVAAPSPAAPSATATAPRVLAAGELQRVDDLHRGMGPVSLIDVGGTRFVRFENVAIQNGPDLHVYLARGSGGVYDGGRDLYLGALKATNGSFNYEVPHVESNAGLSDYRSVVVWCRAFNVLFTWADLR